MIKFQRPVQAHGEYAGVFVVPLPAIQEVAYRMLDEDIGITGIGRLGRHLANRDSYLYDARDVDMAAEIAKRIVNHNVEPSCVTLDDVCHLWYMDMIARFVSCDPTATDLQQYEFYHRRLLREMKTFMVTYKQELIRHFLISYTQNEEHQRDKISALKRTEIQSIPMIKGKQL